MDSDKCDFCGAVHGNTHITYIGKASNLEIAPTPDGGEQVTGYSMNFLPDGMQFRLVKVASLAHAFKNNPILACEVCEKAVWAVVKELKK